MTWTVMTITKKHHGADKLAHLGRVLASKPEFDPEKPTCKKERMESCKVSSDLSTQVIAPDTHTPT